jgi:hypothetical protein
LVEWEVVEDGGGREEGREEWGEVVEEVEEVSR